MLTVGWQGAQEAPAFGKGFPYAGIWEAPGGAPRMLL